LLGPALRCIVGQRLVPRVCTACAEPYMPTAEVLAEFDLSPSPELVGFQRGRGCSDCRGKGRAGRMAVHEVLYLTPPLALAIARGDADEAIASLANAAGYRRMLLDGFEKAQLGLVMPEDVLAVARVE